MTGALEMSDGAAGRGVSQRSGIAGRNHNQGVQMDSQVPVIVGTGQLEFGGRGAAALVKLTVIVLSLVGALLMSAIAHADSGESTTRPYTFGLVAPATDHTCAIITGGGVRCWGNGGFGELGYDSTTGIGGVSPPDTTMSTLTNLNLGQVAVQVSSGGLFSCALLADGSVKCWGSGFDGELGYDSTSNVGDGKPGDVTMANLPAVDLGQRAVELSGGGYHMCAILADGSVKCWGSGASGLGNDTGDNVGDNSTDSIANLGPVNLHGHKAVAISAGGPQNTQSGETCVILDDGSVECFGDNTYGQLGYDNRVGVGQSGVLMANVTPFDPGGHRAVAITTGGKHTCAIGDDGGVRCWGDGQYGELGYDSTKSVSDGAPGDVTMANLPAVNLGGHRAIAVSAGELDTCAILDDDTVRCWGYGGYGSLGYDSENNVGDGVAGHVTMANLGAVNLGTSTPVAIYTGSTWTCALLADGTLRCFGDSGFGQLGYNSNQPVGTGIAGDVTMANLGAVPLGGSIDTTSSNLSLALAPSAATASVGDALTITLTLSNAGPNDSTSSTIGVTLAAGMSLSSVQASQGTDTTSPTISWQPGALAAGGSATLTLHVTVTAGGALTSSAQITAAAPAGPLIGATASTTITDAGTGPAPGTAPLATTGSATAVVTTSVTLAGTVDPNGQDTSAHFEYGTSNAYGSSTPTQDVGSGTTAQSVTATITGLQPGTAYHYRLVATNATGPSDGNDATVTTTTTTAKPTKPGGTLPTKPVPGALKFAAKAKVSRKGVAGVSLSCSGTATTCAGKLTLTATVTTKIKRKLKAGTKTVTVTKTVILGSVIYSIAAGHSKTVSVRLSKTAIKLLNAARHRRLKVTASAKPSIGKIVTKTITLAGS